jgi:hypothetical protein
MLRHLLPGTVVASLLVMLVGCDSDPYQRVVVAGEVSFDGQPVAEGMIRFLPTTETRTPPNGGYIKDGKYEITTRGGVAVGEYRVVIEAFRAGGNQSADQPMSAVDSPVEAAALGAGQYLPAKYNEQTELVVVVESGAPKVTFDFDLTP